MEDRWASFVMVSYDQGYAGKMNSDVTQLSNKLDEFESGMPDSETARLYAKAARRYNRLTGLMSFGSGAWYRRKVIESMNLPEGGVALDLGAGTGDLALGMQEAVGEKGRVVALDPSPEMLAEARRRGVRETIQGTMQSIPLEDDSVDGIACGYAIRYAEDLDTALQEIKRVLKPSARVVILEMTIPTSRLGRLCASLIVRRISPPLMTACCGSRGVGDLMRHFWDSVASFVPPEVMLEKMIASGLQHSRLHGPWFMLMEYRAQG